MSSVEEQNLESNSENMENQGLQHENESNTDSENAPSGSSTKDTAVDIDSLSAHSVEYQREMIVPAENEREEDGSPILTLGYFKRLFQSDWKRYYYTPELNEKLWLRHKGFRKIRNVG